MRTIDDAGFTDRQRREAPALLSVIGLRAVAAGISRAIRGAKMIGVNRLKQQKEWLDDARDEARV